MAVQKSGIAHFVITDAGVRVDWHTLWMATAKVMTKKATCLRKQVGAVAIYQNKIVGTGWNGAPEGEDHCLDVGCLLHDGHCVRCTHAEMNAILQAGSSPIDMLYCTLEPCWRCVQLAIARKVGHIFYDEPYPCSVRRDLLLAYRRPEFTRRWLCPSIAA